MKSKFVTKQLIDDVYNIMVNTNQESIQIDENTGRYSLDNIGPWGNLRIEGLRELLDGTKLDEKETKAFIKKELIDWVGMD